MASLPVVIFQFALSPYKDWHAGLDRRADHHLAVLALSITARLVLGENSMTDLSVPSGCRRHAISAGADQGRRSAT
jgi:hypothetical protein